MSDTVGEEFSSRSPIHCSRALSHLSLHQHQIGAAKRFGKVKASAFEMHICGKSASRADAAAESATEAAKNAANASAVGTKAYEAFEEVSTKWQLGICSKAAQICDLSAEWMDGAHSVLA